MTVYQEYETKLCTADQAVQLVRDGDWVDFSQTCSFPTDLDAALAKRRGEIKDVKLRNAISMKPVQVVEQDPNHESFTYNAWHCSSIDRKYIDKGMAYFSPMMFRNCGSYYRRGQAPVDVAMITVAPMDKDGNFSFGLTNCCQKEMLDAADRIILEVNKEMPVIYGMANDHIHISEVDCVVESTSPICTVVNREANEVDKKLPTIYFPSFKTAIRCSWESAGFPML